MKTNLAKLIGGALVMGALPAVIRRLEARTRWDARQVHVYLCLYYEQISRAATRAGIPLADFLHTCRHHGATHIAIVEDTLDGLLARGEIVQLMGRQPGTHMFGSPRPELIKRLRAEFSRRAPHCLAEAGLPETSDNDERSPQLAQEHEFLILRGDLSAIRYLGLGFDAEIFRLARESGLQLVARPVTYPWPTPSLIERTLAQAAQAGARIISFAHDPILGHEMYLEATRTSLFRHDLSVTYFPDSRHQRGDWFIAKSNPDATILSLRFRPEELDSSDEHGLAYRASLRVSEGGIRLIFADADIGVHATTPTAILAYLEALVHSLRDHAGFVIDLPEHSHDHPGHGESEPSQHGHHHHDHIVPASRLSLPDKGFLAKSFARALTIGQLPDMDDLSMGFAAGLAGLGLLAVSSLGKTSPLLPVFAATAGLLGGALLPYLDRPRSELETHYQPSYSPKLYTLGSLMIGPACSGASLLTSPLAGLFASAVTTAPVYQKRIELIRTYHLDVVTPLALQFLKDPPASLAGKRRWLGVLSIMTLPILFRSYIPSDLIDTLDREHIEGHTHHLSAAQRLIGDLRMAANLRPLRKWTGLNLLWLLYPDLPAGSNQRMLVGIVATCGSIATAGTLRQPSRAISLSLSQMTQSHLLWAPAIVVTGAMWRARHLIGTEHA